MNQGFISLYAYRSVAVRVSEETAAGSHLLGQSLSFSSPVSPIPPGQNPLSVTSDGSGQQTVVAVLLFSRTDLSRLASAVAAAAAAAVDDADAVDVFMPHPRVVVKAVSTICFRLVRDARVGFWPNNADVTPIYRPESGTPENRIWDIFP